MRLKTIMKNLVRFNSTGQNKLRTIQAGKIRSAILMAMLMLALPILLAACGKSEWHETKPVAPVVATDVKPAEAPAPQSTQPVPPAQPAAHASSAPAAPAPVSPPVSRVEPLPAKKAVVQPVPATPKKEAAPVVTPKPETVVKKPEPVPVKMAPAKKLAPSKLATQATFQDADRYVMVQNIATQKLRVYEISHKTGQPNRMVFETDMINGEVEPAKTRRTALGSYKIEKWIKFYQDNASLFPSWYDAPERFASKMGTPPPPPSSISEWTREMYMPEVNGKPFGLVRGAFGWFTAKIGPDAHAQWTHGTVGWGHDQEQFIHISKEELAQFYSDPRGYGCTRVENRAIAYLQDLLPPGTRVVKVYAIETIADKSLARYKNQKQTVFEYALTVDEIRKVNPSSISRPAQILRQVSADAVLEEGEYKVDATPTPVLFKKSVGERNKVSIIRVEANLYDLPETSLQGEFIVDEGRFLKYVAPKELRTGGFKGEVIPSVLRK